jgi:hypothetical protein
MRAPAPHPVAVVRLALYSRVILWNFFLAVKCSSAPSPTKAWSIVFGYPGGAVLHIYDAIFQQDKVKHILVRHEQAAGTCR